jgi:hypothetical protein
LAKDSGTSVRTWGKEVHPGVVLSLAEQPDGSRVLVAVEISPGYDRDMDNVSFERRDDDGNVTLRVPADRISD